MTRPPFVQAQVPSDDTDPPSYPAFAPIISDAFETFKDMPPLQNVRKGSCLLEQALQPAFVYLLRDGLVKLIHHSPDGRESIVGLRAPGWYVGATSALVQRPCPYTVKCLTDVAVSMIPAREFAQWLSLSARRSNHFTQTMCNELLSQATLSQVSTKSADDRLKHFLQESKHPHPTLQTLDVEPFLRRFELAQLLSITPEHLSRMFPKQLEPSSTQQSQWS